MQYVVGELEDLIANRSFSGAAWLGLKLLCFFVVL